MKTVKYLAVILAFITLLSCNKNGYNGNGDSQTRIDISCVRADISGAKALTLCTSDATVKADAEDVSGLYKMDANGNLSYVIFYLEVVTDSTGVETKTAKDLNLSIKPTWMMPYGNDYVLLGGCLADYDEQEIGNLPVDLQDAIYRFCDCVYEFKVDDGWTGQRVPGYWYLLRKDDGKLFDVSLLMYNMDGRGRTLPSPYPNLKDPTPVWEYVKNQFVDPNQFVHINLEKKGFLQTIGNELYVCSLGDVSWEGKIYNAVNGCISRVTNTKEKLIVDELTNRNLNIGRGFVMNKNKTILTVTDQGMVIINPQGAMQSFSLDAEDYGWDHIIQVGDKWYAPFYKFEYEEIIDEKGREVVLHRKSALINPDGSLINIDATYADESLKNINGIDLSRAPKYTQDSNVSILVRMNIQDEFSLIDALGSLSIDSVTDKITLSSFPADFPTDYDLYNDAGVAYILSDDAKTITRYSLATSSSNTYAVDMTGIPSIILPKYTLDQATNTFFVTGYNNQDLISFYIDAETGKATLIGSSTTLKTTTLVPLN